MLNIKSEPYSEIIGTPLHPFLARSEGELDEIYCLRHEAYLAEGLIDEVQDRRFSDKYDDFKNCYNLGLRRNGVLISAIRFHKILPNCLQSPACETYSEIIPDCFGHWKGALDISRLVVAESEPISTVTKTIQLAVLGGVYYNSCYGLFASRAQHLRAYRRLTGFEAKSKPRRYGGLKQPYALMVLHFRTQQEKLANRSNNFQLDASEAERLFSGGK